MAETAVAVADDILTLPPTIILCAKAPAAALQYSPLLYTPLPIATTYTITTPLFFGGGSGGGEGGDEGGRMGGDEGGKTGGARGGGGAGEGATNR